MRYYIVAALNAQSYIDKFIKLIFPSQKILYVSIPSFGWRRQKWRNGEKKEMEKQDNT